MTTRLYAKQAHGGFFLPTSESGVYYLHTSDVDPDIVWFTDRPDRDAGTEPWWWFVVSVWDAVFEDQEPAGGIGYRLEDGVWEVIPARFLDSGYNVQGGAMWKVRLDTVPPSDPLTGVTVYVDDKGADETAEGHTGVYLYAAADASFSSTDTAGPHRLVLAWGLDELILVETPPGDGNALERADHFVEHTWPRYFADVPPNAVITIEGPDGSLNPVVAALSEPEWDAATSTLTFFAEVLLGDPAAASGPATLFIDDWDDHEDTTIYQVVMNHEEQYSIWPADREVPLGWNPVGFQGTKRECLDYIEEVWTDMRPLSLRKKMEEMERQRQEAEAA
jgi:MbtH protein